MVLVFEPSVCNIYQVQYLQWKFLHVFNVRLILVVVAGFLKHVYITLQERDCRQGMFLNCFSYKQLLPRGPNAKWQGLSYTLVITSSVLVVEQAGCIHTVCQGVSSGSLVVPLWLKLCKGMR